MIMMMNIKNTFHRTGLFDSVLSYSNLIKVDSINRFFTSLFNVIIEIIIINPKVILQIF